MPDTSPPFSWEISPDEGGQRLDKALKQKFPSWTNRIILKLFSERSIKRNGKRAAKGDQVFAGDIITIHDMKPIEASWCQPNPALSIPVIRETEQVLFVNKPAGLPVHPLDLWETETLCQGVIAKYPALRGIGEERAPGLLHRLDNETSGVLAFARNTEVFDALIEARQQLRWHKWYVAWVKGKLQKPLALDTVITHHPTDKRKMKAAPPVGTSSGLPSTSPQKASSGGSLLSQALSQLGLPESGEEPHTSDEQGDPRKCLTRVWPMPLGSNEKQEVTERSREATPVLVSIDVGLRHQIRAHLAAAGHPVLFDSLYDDDEAQRGHDQHMMLHAWKLVLPSPPLASIESVKVAPPFSFPRSLEALQFINQEVKWPPSIPSIK